MPFVGKHTARSPTQLQQEVCCYGRFANLASDAISSKIFSCHDFKARYFDDLETSAVSKSNIIINKYKGFS
jgi:hypothetical protein